jgi:hypothetical protein
MKPLPIEGDGDRPSARYRSVDCPATILSFRYQMALTNRLPGAWSKVKKCDKKEALFAADAKPGGGLSANSKPY